MKIGELKQRGFEMILEYDNRKLRCENNGGKYNIIETSSYYQSFCSIKE